MVLFMNLNLKANSLIDVRSKIREIKKLLGKSYLWFIPLIAFFNNFEEPDEQWVKEQGDGIVLDFDLVKINDHKSHSFYTVSSLKEFAKMLDSEWAREWDKANNCKDIVYKLELVE